MEEGGWKSLLVIDTETSVKSNEIKIYQHLFLMTFITFLLPALSLSK